MIRKPRLLNEEPDSEFIGYSVVIIVGFVMAFCLAYTGYPVPRGDDSFYKSPAAELATNGRLTIPCVRGFLPYADEIFASYPQGYQFILSGWYLVFGFSLRSSLAFSFTVHLMNAMCVSAVAARLLRDVVDLTRTSRSFMVAATGLIHVTNVAYFDRPEETALIFIWLEILWIGNPRMERTFSGSLASGLLLGVAALTAPWVGILGALVVSFRLLFSSVQQTDLRLIVWKMALLRLGITGSFSVAIAVTWYLTINGLYPGVMQKQLSVVFGFVENNQMEGMFFDKPTVFLRTLLFNPWHILITVIIVCFFPVFTFSRGWRQTNPLPVALYVAAITSIIVCGLTRPAYTYLGASQMVLLPCFGLTISRYVLRSGSAIQTRIGFAVLIASVVYASGEVGKLCFRSFQLPAAERPDAVFSRLQEIIPAEASVATSSRHWYAFQGRNQWLDAYWCSLSDPPEVLKCQWMVLYPEEGTPGFIDEFELVEELHTQAGRDETYAFSVWRRKPLVFGNFRD